MLYEVSGDILKSKANAIVHGIAPNDHFAQGLALSLREQWPSLAKDFRHYCHVKNPQPGEAWIWSSSEGKRVINLLTQEAAKDHQSNPGKASVEAVNHALRELRKMIEQEGLKSVALPKIATGVGGLEWNQVRPLIEKHLGDLQIPVYLYTGFQKNVEAQEPLPH